MRQFLLSGLVTATFHCDCEKSEMVSCQPGGGISSLPPKNSEYNCVCTKMAEGTTEKVVLGSVVGDKAGTPVGAVDHKHSDLTSHHVVRKVDNAKLLDHASLGEGNRIPVVQMNSEGGPGDTSGMEARRPLEESDETDEDESEDYSHSLNIDDMANRGAKIKNHSNHSKGMDGKLPKTDANLRQLSRNRPVTGEASVSLKRPRTTGVRSSRHDSDGSASESEESGEEGDSGSPMNLHDLEANLPKSENDKTRRTSVVLMRQDESKTAGTTTGVDFTRPVSVWSEERPMSEAALHAIVATNELRKGHAKI